MQPFPSQRTVSTIQLFTLCPLPPGANSTSGHRHLTLVIAHYRLNYLICFHLFSSSSQLVRLLPASQNPRPQQQRRRRGHHNRLTLSCASFPPSGLRDVVHDFMFACDFYCQSGIGVTRGYDKGGRPHPEHETDQLLNRSVEKFVDGTSLIFRKELQSINFATLKQPK